MSAEKDIVRQALQALPTISRRGSDAGALDAWVRLQLSSRYDAALTEALPPEILKLLATVN